MKSRVFVVSVLAFIYVACAVGGNADDFDWPRWRGPNGNGISMETDWNPEALAGGPKVLWKVDVGFGHSNVAIKDNRLYTMGSRTVYCLNAETGKEIWQYSIEDYGDAYSTPAIDGKYIYALNSSGILVCLRARNGKLQWKKNLVKEYETEKIPYGYSGSPVIADDLIILNVNTAGIALDKKSGDLIWASNIHTEKRNRNGYHATPVLYDYEGKRCALLFSGTGLSSVDLETGKQTWFFEWFGPGMANVADPIVFEKRVFISNPTAGQGGVLLDISGGQPKVVWHNKDIINEIGTRVLVDGYLFGNDGPTKRGDALRCVEWKTGEVIWEKEMKGLSLVSANGKLIILEKDGTLRIAEATSSAYQEISSYDVFGGEIAIRQFWTPPVLRNGKIYCRNYHGDLVCIDFSK